MTIFSPQVLGSLFSPRVSPVGVSFLSSSKSRVSGASLCHSPRERMFSFVCVSGLVVGVSVVLKPAELNARVGKASEMARVWMKMTKSMILIRRLTINDKNLDHNDFASAVDEQEAGDWRFLLMEEGDFSICLILYFLET